MYRRLGLKLSGMPVMIPNSGRLLIIFSRNPAPGRVKTRLASTIGADKALQIYDILRSHTDKVTSAVDAHRAVYYSEFVPDHDLFLSCGTTGHLQEGNDLGEKMHRAFVKGFEERYRPIVLIGTDCLELSSAVIEQAFQQMMLHDAVIGPALDGGYYLIGLNRPFPGLFLNRQWSTPQVFRDTVETLEEHESDYFLLPALSDIDTFDDLQKSTLWNRK
jgi:rSAM/selenodomain-associated transferase 1